MKAEYELLERQETRQKRIKDDLDRMYTTLVLSFVILLFCLLVVMHNSLEMKRSLDAIQKQAEQLEETGEENDS